MRKKIIDIWMSLLCSALFVLAPFCALADGASTNNAEVPDVLITEFQTGSNTSGKDEFIELYNAGPTAVDLANWQLRYVSSASSAANLSNPTQTITIIPPAGASNVQLAAGGYFVLHTASATVPQGVAGQEYPYTLPAAGGSMSLFAPNPVTCMLEQSDAVAWGLGTFGLGAAIPASSKDADYQRKVDGSGNYNNTEVNSTDFAAGSPATPGVVNVAAVAQVPAVVSMPTSVVVPMLSCAPPSPSPSGGVSGSDGQSQSASSSGAASGTSDPSATGNTSGADSSAGGASSPDNSQQPSDGGSSQSTASDGAQADASLAEPQITELLPNPAAPQTDSADEFVELYNPNNTPFNIGGFTLTSGTTTLHHYTFAVGTQLPPNAYVAFFSADTGLSLSNDGGRVTLGSLNGITVSQTDLYGSAAPGYAWAYMNGVWGWTTTPTPNAPNLLTSPIIPASATVPPSSPKKLAAKRAVAKTTKTAKAAASKKLVTPKKSKDVAAKTASVAASSLAAEVPPTPIHASVLAFAALFALLYGAYEYRRDVANKFYQLRSYRNARSQARASVARRRGD